MSHASLIPAPPLPLGLTLQRGAGLRLGRVQLVDDAPAPADASPCLHKKDTAEQIRLHVQHIEPRHVLRRIDAVKGDGAHGQSLEIVAALTS